MKYMSVDIETTGLIPMLHGITEFAAVLADDADPGRKPATFYRWINPEGYAWSTYCLMLHHQWIYDCVSRIERKLERSKDYPVQICDNVTQCGLEFMQWYEEVDPMGFSEFSIKKRGNITGTGKNFGTFDLQFLNAWKFPQVFRHRTYDWIQTYQLPSDKMPPDLKLCKERAILMGCRDLVPAVAHNALDDAFDVHTLIQFGVQINAGHRPVQTDDPRQ